MSNPPHQPQDQPNYSVSSQQNVANMNQRISHLEYRLKQQQYAQFFGDEDVDQAVFQHYRSQFNRGDRLSMQNNRGTQGVADENLQPTHRQETDIRQQTSQRGPIEDQKRVCTNKFCCFLFVALILTVLGVSIKGWAGDKFKRLLTVYDAEGKACGVDYPDYPYGYFVAPNYDTLWRTVCVKKCPDVNDAALDCKPNVQVTSCEMVNSTDNEVSVSIYSSSLLANTLCYPQSANLRGQISQAAGKSSISSRFYLVAQAWPIILGSIAVAFILSMLVMYLLSKSSKIVLYFLLGLSVLACPALGVYLLIVPSASKSSSSINKLLQKAFCVIIINFGVFILITLICYRKRIVLVWRIVQIAAKFISQNKKVIYLPLVLFIIAMGFIIIAILEALAIYSQGTIYRNQKQMPFQHYITTYFVRAFQTLHVVQVLWVLFFLVSTCDFIVTGATLNWYYKINNQTASQVQHTQERTNFGSSVHRYFRYHLGSVAMGGLLMAIFSLIKFIYTLVTPDQYGKVQFKWTLSIKSFIDTFCCCCVGYVFNCINGGAYSYIHLTGRPYCRSAINAFSLKLRQIFLTPIITFFNMLFSIVIRTGITLLTVLIAFICLKNISPYKNIIEDATTTCITIGVIAFLISSFFASLYNDSMEAIYICYLLQDGQKNTYHTLMENFRGQAVKQQSWEAERKKRQLGISNASNDSSNYRYHQDQNTNVIARRMKKLKQLDGLKKGVLIGDQLQTGIDTFKSYWPYSNKNQNSTTNSTTP